MKSSSRKEVRRFIPMLILGVALCLASTAARQVITILAGGCVDDGLPATIAALNFPEYAVMDQRGNLILMTTSMIRT